jgi:hypothetical protein
LEFVGVEELEGAEGDVYGEGDLDLWSADAGHGRDAGAETGVAGVS